MSSTVINMVSKKEMSMEGLIKYIKEKINGEFITHIEHKFDDTYSGMIVFEKYYIRNGSYANLCIMLSGRKDKIYADIIGSGGGNGIFNISWGANSDFAQSAGEVLKSLGFKEIEQNSN